MKDQYQEQNRKQKQLHEGPGGGTLQLPFWSDVNWSPPGYYETIQAGVRKQPKTTRQEYISTYVRRSTKADVNNDQQDELFARGPRGILVNVYDPATEQWLPMSIPKYANGNPIWSDAEGWNQPQYYQTIQTADVNGDQIQELLARSAGGIRLWGYTGQWVQLPDGPVWSDQPINGVGGGWDQPQYYETIQCADINGDGQAELLARDVSGIEVWKFVPGQNYPDGTWIQMSRGPAWSDAAGWNLPQYYQTIQCADIDGNAEGTLYELLGQGPDGMEMWAFDSRPDSPTHNTWIKGANVWGPGGNFTQPASYRTIQLADIDGDLAHELIVRTPHGIRAWKWSGTLPADPTGQTWIQLPDGPVWSDQPINGVGGGWDQPQYYETIQCADIDGDGKAELLARDASGIEVWKFVPGQNYPPDGQWIQMSRGPAWSDAAGWNQVERYSTIQTAIVKLPNSNTLQYALLGRGPLGMQTWYQNLTTKTWQQTSAGYPAFTPSQQSAYKQLDTALRGPAANGNIRSVYSDQAAPFSSWRGAMYPKQLDYNTPPAQRPHTRLALPTSNPPSQADWDAVTWQIYWEMTYAFHVNDWYGKLTTTLINQIFPEKGNALHTIGGYMQYSSDDGTQILLSILGLLSGIVAGVAGFPELEAGELAAIAGTLGAAFSGGASLLPNGGNPVQTAYNQLQEQLTNAFSQTTIANGNNQFFITGGTTRGSYVPADWGLLYAVGQPIFCTIWSWPPASETGRLLKAMQQSYAVTVWQALLAASPWYLWWNDSGNGEPPSDFPEQYIFVSYSLPEWITVSSWITYEYPPLSTLAALFDPKTYGAVFPLGVPLSDVYQGNYGWPHLTLSGANLQSPAPQPMPPVPGADLRLTPTLTRDPVTGEVVASITLLNRGLTAATNVEITDARLPGKHPLSALPTRHTRLATGKTETCLVRFPNLTAGQRVVLHLSGKYLGGTFGDSFHVTVP